ncbi:O-antigen ligase [Methylobacterium sp. NEAU K]|uniref:O-antigen ligase family protein n=1 Tax=Methylobacterium sp. NEAU K TaxID=3064946 RepID=UPI002732C29D|nr:O-antigen ligase family protein [Methylobacterium sp. NEAU K]MDP4006131.1 O-antigen ligase family protein [Methylobacterium sp. NEAU K]
MSAGLRLADIAAGPARRSLPRPVRGLPVALAIAFLAYVFIGTTPMADASAVVSGSGSGTERLAVFALAGVAGLILAARARSALRLAVAAWPVWLVLGWFCASVAWAGFPDVSLRRVVVMVLVTVIALAIAVGIGPLRRAHTVLVGMLAVVIAADLAATVLRPDFAFTDIGVRGFHAQKNVAGLVGMVAVIAGTGWALGDPRPRRLAAGFAFVALASGFLVITQSKTSLMLAVLGGLMLPGLLVLRRLGPAAAAALALLTLGGVTVVALGAEAFDTSLAALLTPGSDTSFTGRTEIWDFARAEIARRPWTGFGFGSFWDVGDANDPLLRAPPGTWLATLKLGSGATMVINEAHNGYLDLQLQGGLPALGLVLLAQALTAWALTRQLFGRASGPRDVAAAATFLTLVLVVLVHNMTESSLWMRGQILANLTILISFLAFRAPEPAGNRIEGRP